MKHRKPVIISLVAAVAAVAIGVGGWLVYSNVQLDNAKKAYDAAVVDLNAAQVLAKDAEAARSDALDAYTADVDVAEQLAALLGDGSDVLKAAGEGTLAAREAIDADEAPKTPAKSGSKLKDNPSVEDYNNARVEVEGLTADWNAYTKALKNDVTKFGTDADALKTLWQAQVDTAADDAAAAINANPNASQEAKDAATAAAEALKALTNPLAPEAVDLWKALIDAKNTLAAQEKAYQDQKAAEKAAEEAAARNANRGGSSGGNRGGSSGGSGGNNGGVDYSLGAIAAALAAQLGIPASQVTCYDIANGVRCEWNTPERTGWREFTIG